MRKTSAYARKRRQASRQSFNGAEWQNVIQRCRPYTDEPIPGATVTGTIGAARKALNTVKDALERMNGGSVPPDDHDAFDTLAHAVGVSLIRSMEMGGDRSAAMETLGLAKIAMDSIRARHRRINQWGATRPEQIALVDAVGLYELILMESSPEQMTAAIDKRYEILKAQGWVEPA